MVVAGGYSIMLCRAMDSGILSSEYVQRCYDFAVNGERVTIPSLAYSGGKISFRVKTTDLRGIFFGASNASIYLLIFNYTDTVNSLSSGMGTPSFFVDGVSIGTANPANACQKICDGIEHLIEITNISYTGNFYLCYFAINLAFCAQGKIWDLKIDINNNGVLDAWYKMDEGAGATAIDSSGNNRHAPIASERLSTGFHSVV